MLRKLMFGGVAAMAVLAAVNAPAEAGGYPGGGHHHGGGGYYRGGGYGHHHHNHIGVGVYPGYRPVVPYYAPAPVYAYPPPPVYYNGYAPTYVPPAGIGFQNKNFSLWLGQ